ncbi:helicase protein, partial [Ostertagia ostertagi]
DGDEHDDRDRRGPRKNDSGFGSRNTGFGEGDNYSGINVSSIRFLVLDEADMLLEDGRESHLSAILSDPNFPKPESRQTLLFSATFPADVERFAGKVLRNKYVIVRSSQRGKANVRVKQLFVQADGTSGKNDKLFEILEAQRDKTTDDGSPMRTLVFVGTKKQADFLALMLSEKDIAAASINGQSFFLDGSPMRTLVFVGTKKQADFLALMLSEKDIAAASINGDRPQDERERVVGELRDGTLHVLVGTDVCQRGLDINGLDHVINYDMPNGSPEEVRDKYIHRIGRTGRLHGGVATTFVDSRTNTDSDVLRLIVQVAKETDQIIPDWLNQMCTEDSFTRAGFGASTSFGSKGFGSNSGFGAGGFGSGGSERN